LFPIQKHSTNFIFFLLNSTVKGVTVNFQGVNSGSDRSHVRREGIR